MGTMLQPNSDYGRGSVKLFVSHMTALRYWRSSTELEVASSKRRPCRVRSLRGCVTQAREAATLYPREAGLIMADGHPLEILVPSREQRCPSRLLKPHVWSTTLPHGAFRKLDDDGIYISSPEFVYLQLAELLDAIDLARLGNELCGTYNLGVSAGFGERRPLTSKRRLVDFVKRASASGSYAAAKAQECLQWVVDNSASPKETDTLLALCLPRRFGGYALPLPTLNKAVNVGDRMKKYVNNGVYRPDFMWEVSRNGIRVRVTAEYDSAEHHNYGMKAELTRIRRNDFKAIGYLTNSINNSQLKDADAFEVLVRQIAKDMGRRCPRTGPRQRLRHHELLERLQQDIPR